MCPLTRLLQAVTNY
jgi:hypothetical protein